MPRALAELRVGSKPLSMRIRETVDRETLPLLTMKLHPDKSMQTDWHLIHVADLAADAPPARAIPKGAGPWLLAAHPGTCRTFHGDPTPCAFDRHRIQ
jgi:hypothetical protein